MNKKMIIGLLLVTLIIITGCFSGDISTMGKNFDNSLEKQNRQPTVEKTIQQVKEPKEKFISLGESININNIKFKVDNIKGYKKIGSSMFNKETKGEFYKVCLTLENLGKTSTYLYDTAMIEPQFVLVDKEERQFDSNFEYEMYINNPISMMEQLQPGLPIEGCKIFELPSNSKGLRLLISKGWLTNEAIAVTIKDSEIEHLQAETSMQDKINDQMDQAMVDAQKKMDDLIKQHN